MSNQFDSSGVPRGSVHVCPEITVAELRQRHGSPGLQVIDVREPEEWAAGHIPGSVLMPLDEVPLRIHELDADSPVVTVCRSGRRSLIAADELAAAGFRSVKSLAGGVIAWADAGQPLEP